MTAEQKAKKYDETVAKRQRQSKVNRTRRNYAWKWFQANAPKEEQDKLQAIVDKI